MHRVLIIDDNEPFCRTIQKMAQGLGMETVYETTLSNGIECAATIPFDVVFLDVNLPDGSGLEAIPRLLKGTIPPEIIIITGFGDEKGAEIAINSGVWDYIEKSASFQNIRLSLSRAIEYREQKKRKIARVSLKRDAIVGNSPLIAECLDKVAQAANSESPVFITGETGTGKELFARAIHENDKRSKCNFVVVDCGALPDHLVESVLFGHKKGAFTGAESDQDGLIRQADGGTLFLDEIGELPPEVQKKFLRVIQEKHFRPLGGKREIYSDFRLISATHRNIDDMVGKHQFRQDLLYRIRSLQIELPPLRARPEDIPALVMHRVNRLFKQRGATQIHGLSPEFLDTLAFYPWPGNIRELMNTIDRVLAEAYGEPVLFPRHLPSSIRLHSIRHKIADTQPSPQTVTSHAESNDGWISPLKDYIEEKKRDYIRRLMDQVKRDIPTACRLSGMSRPYLYQLLKKYRNP
jgi:two-component system, NtrC family, response regulator